MHDANCTHDREKMKIMKKMKRKGYGKLRSLLDRVEDSSTSLDARRHPSTVLHVLLLLGGEKMASRVSLLQVEVALDLISE